VVVALEDVAYVNIGATLVSPLTSIHTTFGALLSGIPKYSCGIVVGGCVTFWTYAAPAGVLAIISQAPTDITLAFSAIIEDDKQDNEQIKNKIEHEINMNKLAKR